MKKIFGILAVLAFAVVQSPAAVLMLDFGFTTVTGDSLSNSPYHTANSGFSGTNWNKVQTVDIGSGLVWSDGSLATALSLNLGATTAATTAESTLGLENTPSGNSALGSATNAGVYLDSSVGKDGIFTGSSGNSRAVGFQLSGLAADTYDIYVTARNTNTSNAQSQIIYAGASAASGNFVINGGGSYSSGTLSFANGNSFRSAWVEGENYLKLTVTLSEGDVLNLASMGGGVNEGRGFLNSVQIVAVPEPGTYLMLGLGLAVLFVLRSKLRASKE